MTTQPADTGRTAAIRAACKPRTACKPQVLESAQLFEHHSTVTILHLGEQYTLRLTASNKLILTK